MEALYEAKPRYVYALQFTENAAGDLNIREVLKFTGMKAHLSADHFDDHTIIILHAKNGLERVTLNDFVVLDQDGFFFKCSEKEFHEQYKAVMPDMQTVY